MTLPVDWNIADSLKIHASRPAPQYADLGVTSVFLQGPQWKGKETQIFAWYGLPERAATEKVPGMVLVHGGGGTAFADWVRLWTSRGYAAIAMDVCGGVPNWSNNPYCRGEGWPRHEFSGPGGWTLDMTDDPKDYWLYHAVHAVTRGHSFLRSLPEVDANRTGITGISWGGIITCLAAGLDDRFKFAAPVYGSGCLGATPNGLGLWDIPHREQWLTHWDPAHQLKNAKMPFLWVNGTNDFAFPMPSLYQSATIVPSENTVCLRVNMLHGHGGLGENPEEIRIMAAAHLQGKPGLARVTGQGREGDKVWATYESQSPIVKAELNFTRAEGYWPDRIWTSTPASLDTSARRATAVLPSRTTAWYVNFFDDRGAVVSTSCDAAMAS